MGLPQTLILAIVAMAALAILRLVRVLQFRRTALPDGRGRLLFFVAFVVIPPVLAGGAAALPTYVGVLAAVVIVMWIAAVIIDRLTSSRAGQLVRLALVGSEGDPIDRGLTPVTAPLAESIRLVDRANAVFPRGVEFAKQVSRAGFRADWEALDEATRSLELRIAADRHLGLGVAAAATMLAGDARSRLNTLRRLAGEAGQAWANATT